VPKPDFFLELIHQAMRSDHARARSYLEYFAECIESGEEPDKRVIEWIAEAIREYLDEGVRLEDAFALTKPRGRERTNETVIKEIQAALRTQTRIQAGESRDSAIDAVANELHKSPKSVEKCFDRHREMVVKLAKYSPKET
tara:strand:- start:634 stop:1056 length:423 start_codon:yes stop_codon:yes gene_type:complete